jgi:hypothetical protein
MSRRDRIADGVLTELEKPTALGLLDACKAARQLAYTLGDKDTQQSRDLFELARVCDAAITVADPKSGPWFDENLKAEAESGEV